MPAFHLRTNVFHSYLKITQNPKGTINVVTKGMLSHFVSDLKITNFIFPCGCKSNDEQRRSERTSKRTKLLSDSAITLWEFSLREEVTLQWSFFLWLSSSLRYAKNICKGLITVQVGAYLLICWAYAVRYQCAADPEQCTCLVHVCQCISQQRKQRK